ncbi:hypothetical protein Tco_0607155 [Tanacetum coccineum]
MLSSNVVQSCYSIHGRTFLACHLSRDGRKTRTRWGSEIRTRFDRGIPELTGDGDGDGESPISKTEMGAGMKQCLLVDAGNDMEGNGTAFAGFPGLDLKTVIETAGDLGQISMFIVLYKLICS